MCTQTGSLLRCLTAASAVVLAAAGADYFLRGKEDRLPTPPADRPFQDLAREAGITFRMNFLPGEQGEKFKINLYDHGCGVAVGDYDGDGRDDIYFVNQLGKNALYRNRGDGTFEDVTDKAGVGVGDKICVGATFADYDNDGFPDLFVTSTRGGNILFHNNRDGTFTNVTDKAKVGHVGHSQTAVFFDYDNDGKLDLFVTNSATWTLQALDSRGKYYPGLGTIGELAASPREQNILYHNNGDGTFTDVTVKAGMQGKGWGGDVAVFDYDEDGRMDLLVTNMFGRSQLYHNNGDGTFTDVTASTLKRTSWGAIGAKVFDFDNDGRLDILIVDMHSDMWMHFSDSPESEPDYSEQIDYFRKIEKQKFVMGVDPSVAATPESTEQQKRVADLFQIHADEVVFGNTLLKNLPGGTLEVSDRAGMETFWPWGIATGDFNNDGHEDVFLPSGMGYPFWYWPNYLMMNNGNGTFSNKAEAAGIEPPVRGINLEEKVGKRLAPQLRCAATADFDGTGRLDIVTNNFNDSPYLFKNNFPKKNYVAFRLSGTRCNHDAIGALVKLYAGADVMVRQVNPAGGYLSQSSRTLHFGLGDRTKIDRIEIRWPGTTKPQVIENPEINKLHKITEP